MNKEEKEAIAHLIDMSNLSLIGDGTVIVQNETIATALNLIQKQDKIIDKMAEKLEEKSKSMTKGKWKEFFKKEVEKDVKDKS